MTRVAVVILNYNGEKLLPLFLPSVIQHSPEADIIVADNGSGDRSLDVLKAFPRVRVHRLGGNYGFCGGYNLALKNLDADYYVLLNSDVEVTRDWLKPLLSVLENNRDIAAIQPKILSWHHKDLFEYAGAGGGFIDTLGYPFCRGRIFDHVEKDVGQYDDERAVFWTSGACMMIRAEKFHEHGGFDEEFFAHMEEIDLCWKLNRSGSTVFYSGKSCVYHMGAGTLGYHEPRKTYLNFRNGLFLIFKHMDLSELLYKLPLRIALDWLAGLFFLFKGERTNCMSVLRAHRDFLYEWKRLKGKRDKIRMRHPSYPKTAIHRGLIIFDYYLRGKKSFPLQ